jgi:hypothetical protein
MYLYIAAYSKSNVSFDTVKLQTVSLQHHRAVEIRHLFSCRASKTHVMQVQTISVGRPPSSPLLMIVARATRSDAVGSLTLVIAYTLIFETFSPVVLDHTMRLCLLGKGDSWTVYLRPARKQNFF